MIAEVSPRHLVEQGVACFFGDGVTIGDAQILIHDDRHLGPKAVADPAKVQLADRLDPGTPAIAVSASSAMAGSTASMSRR